MIQANLKMKKLKNLDKNHNKPHRANYDLKMIQLENQSGNFCATPHINNNQLRNTIRFQNDALISKLQSRSAQVSPRTSPRGIRNQVHNEFTSVGKNEVSLEGQNSNEYFQRRKMLQTQKREESQLATVDQSNKQQRVIPIQQWNKLKLNNKIEIKPLDFDKKRRSNMSVVTRTHEEQISQLGFSFCDFVQTDRSRGVSTLNNTHRDTKVFQQFINSSIQSPINDKFEKLNNSKFKKRLHHIGNDNCSLNQSNEYSQRYHYFGQPKHSITPQHQHKKYEQLGPPLLGKTASQLQDSSLLLTHHLNSKLEPKKPDLILVDKQEIQKLQTDLNVCKQENQQLNMLNRRLTKDLDMYMHKDTLKEAQYIIDGQYDNELLPQKYKYLLQEKKQYLKAINFNIDHIKVEVIQLYENQVNQLKRNLALSEENYHELLSSMCKQVNDLNKDFMYKKFKAKQKIQSMQKDIKDYTQQLSGSHQQITSLQDQLNQAQKAIYQHEQAYEAIKREKDNMDDIVKKITDRAKTLKSVILWYKSKYHDIDIGELHKKISLIQGECHNLKVVNQRLNNNLTKVKDNHIKLKKKISQVTGIVIFDQHDGEGEQNGNLLKKILQEDSVSDSDDDNIETIGLPSSKPFDPLSRDQYEFSLKKNYDLITKF
eukprot:403361755